MSGSFERLRRDRDVLAAAVLKAAQWRTSGLGEAHLIAERASDALAAVKKERDGALESLESLRTEMAQLRAQHERQDCLIEQLTSENAQLTERSALLEREHETISKGLSAVRAELSAVQGLYDEATRPTEVAEAAIDASMTLTDNWAQASPDMSDTATQTMNANYLSSRGAKSSSDFEPTPAHSSRPLPHVYRYPAPPVPAMPFSFSSTRSAAAAAVQSSSNVGPNFQPPRQGQDLQAVGPGDAYRARAAELLRQFASMPR
jgi:hypothetical protein